MKGDPNQAVNMDPRPQPPARPTPDDRWLTMCLAIGPTGAVCRDVKDHPNPLHEWERPKRAA